MGSLHRIMMKVFAFLGCINALPVLFTMENTMTTNGVAVTTQQLCKKDLWSQVCCVTENDEKAAFFARPGFCPQHFNTEYSFSTSSSSSSPLSKAVRAFLISDSSSDSSFDSSSDSSSDYSDYYSIYQSDGLVEEEKKELTAAQRILALLIMFAVLILGL